MKWKACECNGGRQFLLYSLNYFVFNVTVQFYGKTKVLAVRCYFAEYICQKNKAKSYIIHRAKAYSKFPFESTGYRYRYVYYRVLLLVFKLCYDDDCCNTIFLIEEMMMLSLLSILEKER